MRSEGSKERISPSHTHTTLHPSRTGPTARLHAYKLQNTHRAPGWRAGLPGGEGGPRSHPRMAAHCQHRSRRALYCCCIGLLLPLPASVLVAPKRPPGGRGVCERQCQCMLRREISLWIYILSCPLVVLLSLWLSSLRLLVLSSSVVNLGAATSLVIGLLAHCMVWPLAKINLLKGGFLITKRFIHIAYCGGGTI